MIRLRPNVQQGAHCFPYVIPADRDGEPLEVSAVQSVTWSLYEIDGTPIVADVAIGAADAEGKWVANVLPTYTTFETSANKELIIVFTVTFAATIGGVAYTDLTAKIHAQLTVEPVEGESL